MGHYTRILGLSFLLFCADASASWLHWCDDVPNAQRTRIERDLEEFSLLPAVQEDPILARMLELREATPEAFLEWIRVRVKYVTGRKFDIDAPGITMVLREGVNYPQKRELPWGVAAKQPAPTNESLEQPKSVTEMSNLGSAVFLDGKLTGNLLGLRLPGISEPVPVTSPRVGVVQIDRGLFQSPDPDRLAARLHRVSTLLHEARHSDGNGKSLGFFHFVCPDGSDYPGEEACDVAENGSYAIEARALKIFASTCGKDCTKKEREILRVEAADMLARVFDELPAFSGEDAMPLRKKCLERGDRSEECRKVLTEAEGGIVPIVKASWWDTRPETLTLPRE